MFIYESKIFRVGKYEKVLHVDASFISILLKNKKKIEIKGSDLMINYYDSLQIDITGSIKSVVFIDD